MSLGTKFNPRRGLMGVYVAVCPFTVSNQAVTSSFCIPYIRRKHLSSFGDASSFGPSPATRDEPSLS